MKIVLIKQAARILAQRYDIFFADSCTQAVIDINSMKITFEEDSGFKVQRIFTDVRDGEKIIVADIAFEKS